MIYPGLVGSRGYLYKRTTLEIGVRGYLIGKYDIRKDADGDRRHKYKEVDHRKIFEEEMEIISVMQAFVICEDSII